MTALQTGELAAMATAILWTLSALAWTIAGRQVGSLPVSFLRLLIACVLLSGYGWVATGQLFPMDADARTWWVLGISGFSGFFVCDACLFEGLVLVGPRLTLLLQSLTPPIAAVLSWGFLGESMSTLQIGAMCITIAGVVWVVLERQSPSLTGPSRQHTTTGVLLGVAAAAAGAVGVVMSREGIGDYDAVGATYIRILCALPGYLILLTVIARWPSVTKALCQRRPMLVIFCGSIVGPFLGVILCMVALRHCSAGMVATILSIMPVLVLPFSIIVFREKVSWRAGGGAVVAVLGVALMCWAP